MSTGKYLCYIELDVDRLHGGDFCSPRVHQYIREMNERVISRMSRPHCIQSLPSEGAYILDYDIMTVGETPLTHRPD